MTWRTCTLGDVVKLQRGHDLPERQRIDGSIPIVSSSGTTGRHNVAKADPPGVVTGRYGTIGEVFFVEEPYWPLNTALYAVDFKGNDPRFVAYLLRNTLKNYKSEKAAVPGVDRNVLHLLKVRAPSKAVQEKVAALLSAYDDLIENNRRRMELLEEAARMLYREWFVHFRFPGHGQVQADGLPQGWGKKTLLQCVSFQSGGTPSKAKPEYWTGDVPWISSGELTSMRVGTSKLGVTEEAVEDGSRYAEKDTILAVVRGMSLAKEFRIGIASRRVCFNQDVKALVPDRGVEGLYLFHSLLDRKDRIRQQAGEASHGTKKLETAVLEEIPIVIPPPRTRQLFVESVEPLHSQWDVLSQQNRHLESARDLLLPRLMNGEIAV